LLYGSTRVIDVLTAVIAAEGDHTTMTTQNVETTNTTAAVAEQGAPVAPEKAASKKATSAKKGAPKRQKSAKGGKPKAAATAPPKKEAPAKKASKAPKAPKPQADGVRKGSKTAKILDLLKRPGGVTLKEIVKASGWQPHSVRGFLSGTIGKKMKLALTSTKDQDGNRVYSVGK
jgi:Protein of unknown function (DUF3489)